MQKTEPTPVVWRIVCNILATDLILAAVVGIVCFIFSLRTLEAFSTVLGWSGGAVIIFAGLTGIGGFASRVQDATAYTLSGAGDMIENLRQISQARSSNLGCLVQLLLIGLGLIAIGYLVQFISTLLKLV